MLSALRVRTDDAELGGQLEVQPAERAGKGKLKLTAPGIEASVNGELRQSSGKGELGIKARDAARRGIGVVPPDVNASGVGCDVTVDGAVKLPSLRSTWS